MARYQRKAGGVNMYKVIQICMFVCICLYLKTRKKGMMREARLIGIYFAL